MSYCPKLSSRSLHRLRRIAWAVDRPMTKTLDRIIELVCSRINAQSVCNACLDANDCKLCGLAEMIRQKRRQSNTKNSKNRAAIRLSDLE